MGGEAGESGVSSRDVIWGTGINPEDPRHALLPPRILDVSDSLWGRGGVWGSWKWPKFFRAKESSVIEKI